MKENGWVCETYEEFRRFYPVPKMHKEGYTYVNPWTKKESEPVTFEEQETYMRELWENWKNAIENRDGIIFPVVDIRNLKVESYEAGGYDGSVHDTYTGINNLSTIYRDVADDSEAENAKNCMVAWILYTPEEIKQALGDLYKYYKDNKKYGEVYIYSED